MIRAAGIIVKAPSGRVLMLRRGPNDDHPDEWTFPGGKIEGDETTAAAALREFEEETGHELPDAGTILCTRVAENVHFTTFLQNVPEEFQPKLCDESVAWAWVEPKGTIKLFGVADASPSSQDVVRLRHPQASIIK